MKLDQRTRALMRVIGTMAGQIRAAEPSAAKLEQMSDEELQRRVIWDDVWWSYAGEFRRRHRSNEKPGLISENLWMAYRDELRRRHPLAEIEAAGQEETE